MNLSCSCVLTPPHWAASAIILVFYQEDDSWSLSLWYMETHLQPHSQMALRDNRTEKQVGRQTRDINEGRMNSQTKKEDKHVKEQRKFLCDLWRERVKRAKGMVIRKRKDWLVGKEQEISGRESKQVYVEKRRKQEKRKTEIWKRSKEQRELHGPWVGAAFLQTHKPKFRNGHSKNLNADA